MKGISIDTQFAGGAILTYSYDGAINTDEIGDLAESVIDRPVTVQVTSDPATGSQNMVITLAGHESITPEQQQSLNAALQEKIGESVALSESYIVEPFIGKKAMTNSAITNYSCCIFCVMICLGSDLELCQVFQLEFLQ